MKKILSLFLLSLLIPSLQGQVEHKREWFPVRVVEAQAPPPPHLEERVRRFEERDSEASLRQLAGELFGLMNPDYVPENTGQAELYRKAWSEFRSGRPDKALEMYKQFAFARIRSRAAEEKGLAVDPSKRTFIEFYNTPDELMRGVFRFQMFDRPFPREVVQKGVDATINYYRAGKHNPHMVDIILQNGQPGRMNWTYVVPDFFPATWHIPSETGFAAIAYRQNMCFSSLLAAYVAKGEKAYLDQWVGYIEDHLLNFRKDLADAGIVLPVSPSGAGGPMMAHVAYVVLNAPNVDRDFPASTFARLQLRNWIEDIPLIQRGVRSAGANRAMHMYGALLTEARKNYPELAAVDSLLEARRRILESYARQYMMPDGSSIDYAPNYNKNFIVCTAPDIAFLQSMNPPPEWFGPAWVSELQREQSQMARYLIHTIAPDGTLPGYKNVLHHLKDATIGDKGFLKSALPQSLTDPRNAAVVANLLGTSEAKDPGYTSEAFPYGGYYVMRENWSPEARFLYFHDYRPGSSSKWRHHKNIYVQAFGQRMLSAFRWESPLLVDGAGHIHEPFADLYPPSYDGKRGLFGTQAERSAWQEPLANRWHASDRFDFAEGGLKIPFAQKFDEKPSVFVDDVAHLRQVLFLRQAGAWIVTDRIEAEKPHDYHLLWGFEADRINPEGWDEDWRKKGKAAPPTREDAYSQEQIVADAKAQAVRTANPNRPNLSIFHAASLPLVFRQGEILQNNDSMFGNTFQAGPGFRADRAAVVASLLYPRKTGAPDVAVFSPVSLKDGAGFDARTPEGIEIQYRAALEPQDLVAGRVAAKAATLAVCGAAGQPLSGVALDCSGFSVGGKPAVIPSADFEFAVDAAGSVTFQKIHRPLGLVRILPERDVFLGEIDVTFEHDAPDVDIRYTVDGSDPTPESPVFSKPVRLTESATVRAAAFRKDARAFPPTADSTRESMVSSAFFKKAPALWPAKDLAGLQPGLAFRYYEDDWTLSLLKLPVLTPLRDGIAPRWMDVSERKENANSYGFVYDGYLRVPKDGVYTFHGPWELYDVGEHAGYELRIEVNGVAWYPGSRAHNYSNWSIPLAAGLHPIKVSFVDVRPGGKQVSIPASFFGEKPEVLISGPGVETREVPAEWLFHAVDAARTKDKITRQ